MSKEFTSIRKIYLYSILSDNDNQTVVNVMQKIFPSQFIKFIDMIIQKHGVNKTYIFLKKFMATLKERYDTPVCYVEFYQEINKEEKMRIEDLIKSKFNLPSLDFVYNVNANLIYGMLFRLHYQEFNINLQYFLKNIKSILMQKLSIEGDLYGN